MFAPIVFAIDKNLVTYVENGDSSFTDYYGLPDSWLEGVDAQLAAIGASHWGDFGERVETGRCDITGGTVEVVQAIAYIRITGFKVDSDACPRKVYRLQKALCERYPDAIYRTCSVTGIVYIEVDGARFTFYPKNKNMTRCDIRVTHAA